MLQGDKHMLDARNAMPKKPPSTTKIGPYSEQHEVLQFSHRIIQSLSERQPERFVILGTLNMTCTLETGLETGYDRYPVPVFLDTTTNTLHMNLTYVFNDTEDELKMNLQDVQKKAWSVFLLYKKQHPETSWPSSVRLGLIERIEQSHWVGVSYFKEMSGKQEEFLNRAFEGLQIEHALSSEDHQPHLEQEEAVASYFQVGEELLIEGTMDEFWTNFREVPENFLINFQLDLDDLHLMDSLNNNLLCEGKRLQRIPCTPQAGNTCGEHAVFNLIHHAVTGVVPDCRNMSIDRRTYSQWLRWARLHSKEENHLSHQQLVEHLATHLPDQPDAHSIHLLEEGEEDAFLRNPDRQLVAYPSENGSGFSNWFWNSWVGQGLSLIGSSIVRAVQWIGQLFFKEEQPVGKDDQPPGQQFALSDAPADDAPVGTLVPSDAPDVPADAPAVSSDALVPADAPDVSSDALIPAADLKKQKPQG